MATYHADERLVDALDLLLGNHSCQVIDQFLAWKAGRWQPFQRDHLKGTRVRIECHKIKTKERTTDLQLLRQAEVHLLIILAKLFHKSLDHLTPAWSHILSKQMQQQTQPGDKQTQTIPPSTRQEVEPVGPHAARLPS